MRTGPQIPAAFRCVLCYRSPAASSSHPGLHFFQMAASIRARHSGIVHPDSGDSRLTRRPRVDHFPVADKDTGAATGGLQPSRAVAHAHAMTLAATV